MSDYIERKDVLKLISEWKRKDVVDRVAGFESGWNEALEQIECNVKDDIPAADVAAVVHGKWEETKYSPIYSKYACTNCGRTYIDNKKVTYNYCPECGAKMEHQQ